MADNSQKTPLARSLESFTAGKVNRLNDLLGKSLPASVIGIQGSIVTVKFELTDIPFTLGPIAVPMMGAEYIRLPIQIGTKGWVMTADAYLGGMSGLGGGIANLTQRGNLSTLVWSPIANANWSAPDDPNAVVIYGPNGAIIRDLGKKNIFTLTPSEVTLALTVGGFTVTVPAGQAMTINGNLVLNGNFQISGTIESETGGIYAGDISTSGNITARAGTGGSVGVATHGHTQGVDSHGDSEEAIGAPTPGT